MTPDPSTEALRTGEQWMREQLRLIRFAHAEGRLTEATAHQVDTVEVYGKLRADAAALAARLSQAEEALRVADDLLRRLSEWDVLNLPRESMSDGPYWQGEIRIARAALAASSAGETPDG